MEQVYIEKWLGCVLYNTTHLLLCTGNATNSSVSSPDLWVISLHPGLCPQLRVLFSTSKSGAILQARSNVHMMATFNNLDSWLLLTSISRDILFHLYAAIRFMPLI